MRLRAHFRYPAGASDWVVRFMGTDRYGYSLSIKDLSTGKVIYSEDLASEDNCERIWQHIKSSWEQGKCYLDAELGRLVWRSAMAATTTNLQGAYNEA